MGGQGSIELPDREFVLPEAALLLLPPGCPHRERTDHSLWDTLWLGFRGDLPEKLGLTTPTMLENGHALRPWCEQVWLWRQRETGTTGPELAALTEFLIRAFARLVQTLAGSIRKPWLASVQDYLETHLERDLSIEELAAVAGYSAGHFHREFRRATGETPVQYLTRRRLETARLYLRQSGLPIREIAAAVGFSDPLYFSRVFRRHFGCSPSQLTQASRPEE
jgi:AraC-like DNA-binding protein